MAKLPREQVGESRARTRVSSMRDALSPSAESAEHRDHLFPSFTFYLVFPSFFPPPFSENVFVGSPIANIRTMRSIFTHPHPLVAEGL